MWIFIISQIFLFLFCFCLLNLYVNYFSYLDKLIASFLIYTSLIILSVTVLSYFGFLSLHRVSLSIIFLTLILFIPVLKEFRRLRNIPESLLKPFLPYLKENRGFLLYVFLFLNLVGLFFIIYHNVMFPPSGYDAFSYHLPVVCRIVQDHGFGIYNVPSALYMNYNVFPKNAELLFAYNFIFLKTDRFLEIIHIPFVYFSALSIYSICRHFKISKKNSLLAFAFPFIPIVVQQMVTCYIDIIFSAFVLMSVNFLLKKKPVYILFSIISASLALGTKGTGIPFIMGIIMWIIIFNYKWIFNYKKFLKYVFVFLFISLSLGAHFYIRNIILFNSPIGDFELSIGKITIKRGQFPVEAEKRNIFSTIFEIPSRKEEYLGYYSYDTRVGGFGPLFAVFFLPAVFLGFIKGIIKKNGEILILFFLLFSIYLILPYKWWTRFHIYFAGISIVFFAYLIEEFSSYFHIFFIPLLILSFIGSYKNIAQFHVQNFFPYNCRKLYFSMFGKLMGDIKRDFLPQIQKNDTIFFYHVEGATRRYYQVTGLSYNFMKPDYRVYHQYIFSIHDLESLGSPKWIITPEFVEKVRENYVLIYRDNDLKIWKRK